MVEKLHIYRQLVAIAKRAVQTKSIRCIREIKNFISELRLVRFSEISRLIEQFKRK